MLCAYTSDLTLLITNVALFLSLPTISIPIIRIDLIMHTDYPGDLFELAIVISCAT